MNIELKSKMEDAIWVGKTLFDRCKTSGSSANMSFLHDGNMYITGSGTCFGRLEESSFSMMDWEGNHVDGIKPSKEWPLHLNYYKKDSAIQAVVHTHGTYAVLWSCISHKKTTDMVPEYTPYLKMKVGKIGLIPYAKPGSEELFQEFINGAGEADAYLLANHGGLVGGKSVLDAFYGIEELEESCRIAWEIEGKHAVMQGIR